MDTQRLQTIYNNAGRPGAAAFRFQARRQGVEISEAEAKAFVASQSQGQIFQGKFNSDGKIPAGSADSSRAQADLIDFSKRISKLRGRKYVLIVVDLFDRQIFTVPQSGKGAAETLASLKRVIRANNNVMFGEITVDLGGEFAKWEEYIESQGGVLRRKNLAAVNTIAVVDAAISKLKRILSGFTLTDWAGALSRATSAYNEASHSALMGSAPNDVKDSKALQYEQTKQNGLDIIHNNKKWKEKSAKLKDEGAFRVPLPRKEFEPIDAPKYEGKVREVGPFKGANIEDTEGNSYPVKTILAVPRGSADVDLGDAGPGQGRKAKQREMLQDFATDLKSLIPSTGLTLARVTSMLNAMPGFENTADVYGPARKGRIVNFLKLYPNLFRIEGKGAKIQVYEATPVPRPVQVGGAGSSTDAMPVARPGGSRVRVGGNAPSRLFPDNLRVRYGPNPVRPGTFRHARYELYKDANTIKEARDKGALSSDIQKDIAVGALQIL